MHFLSLVKPRDEIGTEYGLNVNEKTEKPKNITTAEQSRYVVCQLFSTRERRKSIQNITINDPMTKHWQLASVL
jgi:hypothetical protein